MTVIMVCVVTVMLLIWLLLRVCIGLRHVHDGDRALGQRLRTT